MSATMGDEEGKVLSTPKFSSALSFVASSTLDLPVTPWRIPVPQDPNHVYSISSFPPLSTFDIAVEHAAIIVPVRRTAELRNTLKQILLHRPKMTNVYPLVDSDPIPAATAASTSNDGPPPRSLYRKLVLADRKEDCSYDHDPSLKALLESGECCQGTQTLTAGYADWTLDEVLSKLLPVDGNVPSSFESIGHLAHINLREELLPYKHLIGKVLLDKNTPRIQTVVNKIGNIETEYRTFGMEVIAGKDETGWSNVRVKEDGCQYDLDFREVYWNSRLGGEHRRLVALIRKDADTKSVSSSATAAGPMVVADLMAGIGPFAVPLTSSNLHNNNKKESTVAIQVHANDLNPQSFKYLKINAKTNNCKRLTCYNMDARAFCHSLQDQGINFHHVLMNLPASAPEFLDAFRGFKGTTLPRIHVHCFGSKLAPPTEAERECIDRCSKALGCSLDEKQHDVTVHTVRDVSPTKNMYCVSFTLPEQARDLPGIVVLPRTTNPGSSNDDDETNPGPRPKRTKV